MPSLPRRTLAKIESLSPICIYLSSKVLEGMVTYWSISVHTDEGQVILSDAAGIVATFSSSEEARTYCAQHLPGVPVA